jgi:photosystem II stability/assembly factor-like uncharacterized protein
MASAADSRETTASGSSSSAAAKRGNGKRRWFWLAAGAILMAAATLAAFLQPPQPVSYVPQNDPWQRFTQPIERNAAWRLPSIGVEFSGVSFTDAEHGWAVGYTGAIVATSDGGAHWAPQTSGTTQILDSVHFADAGHGWAVGTAGTIIATSDGGAHWALQTSGTAQDLNSVYFADPVRGWAVGTAGTIVATSDGGAHWALQTSGTAQDLNSVYFADPAHGWAVGATGTILPTSDGGAHWTRQTSGTTENFLSVYFVDAGHGWAVGTGGVILATSDGGANWTRQTSGTTEYLKSAYFADAGHGWAVGEDGLIATSDGGAHWAPQASGAPLGLSSVHFLDDSHGWAVSEGGTIVATSDGGAHWVPQASGTAMDLASVHFVDAAHGWALAGNAIILATSDGGAHWTLENPGTTLSLVSVNLESVDFADAAHGWAVGTAGTIVATSDGGAHWTPQTSGTSEYLNSVHFPDAAHGWAVGTGGTIVVTSDGGAYWTSQTSGTALGLASVHFVDAAHGWVVSGKGTIITTIDGGVHWTQQTSGTTQYLFSVYFPDAAHGWAVGTAGTIVATSDGGAHWAPQISRTTENLYSVDFADASHGWAGGGNGTILATSDGGAHWTNPVAAPARYPAPWYYVAVAFSLLLTLPALAPIVVERPSDSAANRQVCDNPIGPGDLDALGLGDIALGLSQFFRNRDTKPPLTVGILGEWGQGKSSVMRLLEADLRKNCVFPAWFNAWHYQKEDHLLAYLLEAIRNQAVPRLHTLQGLRFRARLLGIRSARGRWSLVALAMLAAFCVGISFHPGTVAHLAAWLQRLTQAFSSKGNPQTSAGAVPFGFAWLAVVALYAGPLFLLLQQINRSLSAFKVNPAALIKDAAGSASIKDLSAKTSLRASFAAEFKDVIKALDPYRVVIFIDDLDRCNPRSVTQILESVNFLTSAGDCFIVMGLAKAQVEASVGLSFKEVAEELGDGKDGKRQRRDYAQQYLRKLINLEVTVPTATAMQQKVLLAGRHDDAKPVAETDAQRMRAFWRANRSVTWVAATVALAAASLWYGLTISVEAPPESPSQTVAVIQNPVPPEPVRNDNAKVPVAPAITNSAVSFVEGREEKLHLTWLPVLPGLLLLGFSAWVLTRRPNEIIHDSERFSEALDLWQPVIGMQFRTPRDVKRFLNRVRYIAMRWRRAAEQTTPLERIAGWLLAHWRTLRRSGAETQTVNASSTQGTDMNEAGLVAMAALDGLGGENFDSRTQVAGVSVSYARSILTDHVTRFGGLNWARFREITGEVETN